MGCFSFLCKECGKGINSTSFDGEECELHLLKDGAIIQTMKGQYDSYGRCFIEGTVEKGCKNLMQSDRWKIPWDEVCDLMSNKHLNNGIAAVHKKCKIHNKCYQTRSEDDPDQGWGEKGEFL